MDDFEGLLRLNLISGIDIKTYRNLIEHLGSVKSILDCPKSRLEKIPGIGTKIADRIINGSKAADVDKEIKLAEKDNVKIVPFASDQFPYNLKQIYDPPLVLYIKGDILKSDTLALAIVGARRCSYYGWTQAERFAVQLAQAGFCVVSGYGKGN